MAPSTPHLLTIPQELRDEIYGLCFKVEGGLKYNHRTNKLHGDGDRQPADYLNLALTCKQLGNELRGLPLALNQITFTTAWDTNIQRYAGGWDRLTILMKWAGIWIMEHLKPLITDDMRTEITQKYPEFRECLDALASGQLTRHGLDRRLGDGMYYFTHESSETSQEGLFGGARSLHYQAQNELLKLILRKTPPEAVEQHCARELEYGALPKLRYYITRSFIQGPVGFPDVYLQLCRNYQPWSFPTEEDVVRIVDQLHIPEMRLEDCDASERCNKSLSCPYTRTEPGEALQCVGIRGQDRHVKHRFSAAACAIRFLRSLPRNIRQCCRLKLLVHEGRPSVENTAGHAQGLIQFCHANSLITIERRVDLVRNVFAGNVYPHFNKPRSHLREWNQLLRNRFCHITNALAEWLVEADALSRSPCAMPDASLTLVLDGGPRASPVAQWTTEIFEDWVLRAFYWQQAADERLAQDHGPPFSDGPVTRVQRWAIKPATPQTGTCFEAFTRVYREMTEAQKIGRSSMSNIRCTFDLPNISRERVDEVHAYTKEWTWQQWNFTSLRGDSPLDGRAAPELVSKVMTEKLKEVQTPAPLRPWTELLLQDLHYTHPDFDQFEGYAKWRDRLPREMPELCYAELEEWYG
jgi:hypothetical protein